MPHVESSFHPVPVPRAATGMWQFMRESAKPYMRVDALVETNVSIPTNVTAALEC